MKQKQSNKSTGQAFRDAMFDEHVGEAADEVTDRVLKAFTANFKAATDAQASFGAMFKGWPGLPSESNLTSLAQLCRDLAVAPQTIRAVCEAGNIEPAMMVDQTPFFTADDVYVISGVVRGLERRDREQQQQTEKAHAQ